MTLTEKKVEANGKSRKEKKQKKTAVEKKKKQENSVKREEKVKTDKSSKEYYRSYYKQMNTSIRDSNKFKMAHPVLNTEESVNVNKTELKPNECILTRLGTFQFLGKCIFCLNFSEKYILVGLRSCTEPLNAFEVKTGNGNISVFDRNLNYLKALTFTNGDPVQIERDCGNFYILFSDGKLIKITENDIEKDKAVESSAFIESELKITSFCVENGEIAVTDGFFIACNNHTLRVKSMVIQMLMLNGEIYFLDIQSKVFKASPNLQKITEVFSDCRIVELKKIGIDIIAILENNVFLILGLDSNQKDQSEFFKLFINAGNGVISCFKHRKGRRKELKILQIAESKSRIEVKQSDFTENECNSNMRILDVGSSLLIAFESGYLIQIPYF